MELVGVFHSQHSRWILKRHPKELAALMALLNPNKKYILNSLQHLNNVILRVLLIFVSYISEDVVLVIRYLSNTALDNGITRADYNTEHTVWGYRLITPRGRVVLNTMKKKKKPITPLRRWAYILAVRLEQTDRPSWLLRHKGITQTFAIAKSCFDLSSDHSPVIVTLTTQM
jgi:hypothetical protein